MIYLDHAAATPVDRRVLEAMEPYFAEKFYNPSAAYLPAKEVSADYEAAKATIAHAIGAKASDLVITAGATEANNLAFTCLKPREYPSFSERSLAPVVTGIGRSVFATSANMLLERGHSSRLLYLVTEHDSVRRVAEQYGGEAIGVLPNGLIDLEELKRKITDETELISVSLANNELGTIQPLAEVARIIREVKLERMKRGLKRQLLLHSDASQALNLLDINVARLGVDLMTLNAAKVYGPKGVGALYVSHEAKLSPLTYGGGQENGLRSGTENVPGVIGFAEAVRMAKEHLNGNRKKYAAWRKILLSELQGYELINKQHALDSFVVLCYNDVDAERLVFLLEEKGVYVATGAACAASKGVKSHVLKAIGLTNEQIAGSLRLTVGETNTEEQIYEAAKIINGVIEGEYDRCSG
ncbi:cysteine desulfurase [Candidatus Saccharibacteria bacterium]|nr:cysteine desulfurase [Candidatus Saccharibacteria bacterium]